MSESAKDVLLFAQAAELQRCKAELETLKGCSAKLEALQYATRALTPTARYCQESGTLVVLFPAAGNHRLELRIKRRSIAISSLIGGFDLGVCEYFRDKFAVECDKSGIQTWIFLIDHACIEISLDKDRQRTFIQWRDSASNNGHYHHYTLSNHWMIWTKDTFNAMCRELDNAFYDFLQRPCI